MKNIKCLRQESCTVTPTFNTHSVNHGDANASIISSLHSLLSVIWINTSLQISYCNQTIWNENPPCKKNIKNARIGRHASYININHICSGNTYGIHMLIFTYACINNFIPHAFVQLIYTWWGYTRNSNLFHLSYSRPYAVMNSASFQGQKLWNEVSN